MVVEPQEAELVVGAVGAQEAAVAVFSGVLASTIRVFSGACCLPRGPLSSVSCIGYTSNTSCHRPTSPAPTIQEAFEEDRLGSLLSSGGW